MTPKARARVVHERLSRAIPKPRCELDHADAWQLLVATILSAQSTDKIVNKVTPEVFRRWRTPAALAAAPQEDVEAVVKATGFFRNKAKAIRAASQQLVTDFDGVVPRDIEALVTLHGVARKTANVVIGTAYGIPTGIVVDTHVTRVSRLLRLTRQHDPVKIERDLCKKFAKETWVDTSHRLVLHGRYLCTAKSPDCAACPLAEVCPSAEAAPEGTWEERADRERELIPERP